MAVIRCYHSTEMISRQLPPPTSRLSGLLSPHLLEMETCRSCGGLDQGAALPTCSCTLDRGMEESALRRDEAKCWMLVTEHWGHLCCCCLCPVDLNDCFMCWYPVVGDSKFKAQVQIFILLWCGLLVWRKSGVKCPVNALSSLLPWSYKHSHYFISFF